MAKKFTPKKVKSLTKISDNLLLIFTRNPELGKCKTRLAATIGDTAALKAYKFLLGHTVKITKDLNVDKQVYYSEEIWENDIWPSSIFNKKSQTGIDLGERMQRAFQQGFETGHKKIVIIGSDMFDLSQTDLEEAFAKLDESDFVIGPAEDGGYYLLGMKKLDKNLFNDKTWGTSTVLKDTLANLENEKIALLPIKNDVDLYEDIKDIKAFWPFIEHVKNDTETT